MTTVLERTAAAPISWGVCEVPGWGIQLPVERVLREMSEVGLRATELGSIGYLPTDPAELARTLRSFGLALTGGFNPLALADPARRDETLDQVHDSARLLADAGATDYVTCVVSDPNNWTRPELTDSHWSNIFSMLDVVGDTVATTLSGGERQSVAIARAVYFGAKVLILDEPTSALGVKQSGVVLRYIVEARNRGLGVIFITHNPSHAYPVGDRFLILNRGQSMGNFAKEDITLSELTQLMAGGAELEQLQHELEQAVSGGT